MDHNRLYQLFLKGSLCDLELKLDDGFQFLTLQVHKIVLVAHSSYFLKLLTFGPSSNELTLNTPNADIVRDIILSFYGQKIPRDDLDYLLLWAKCRDYFGLETTLEVIPKEIEAKDYDKFLDLCCLIGFDEDLIKTLTKNLPKNYDLSKLSKELIKIMIEIDRSFGIITTSQNMVNVMDVINNKCIESFYAKTYTKSIVISANNKFLAIVFINEKCQIFTTKSVLKYIFDDCIDILFSPDNMHFAIKFSYIKKGIKIYDLSTGKKIAVMDRIGSMDYIYHSPNSKYFIAIRDSEIRIYHANSYKILHTICFDDYHNIYNQIHFSNDSKYFDVYGINSEIKIFDIESAQIKYPEFIIEAVSFTQYKNIPGWISDKKIRKEYMAVQNADYIAIYDMDKNIIRNFNLRHDQYSIYFSPQNTNIILGLWMKDTISIYNITTDSFVLTNINCQAFEISANDEYFAIFHSGSFRIYHMENNFLKFLYTFRSDILEDGYDNTPTMEFTPDSKYLVYASFDYIWVHDAATGTRINIYNQNIKISSNMIISNVVHSKNAQRLLEIIE